MQSLSPCACLQADAESSATTRALPCRQALLWVWGSGLGLRLGLGQWGLSPSVGGGQEGSISGVFSRGDEGGGMLKRVEEEISQLMWAVALLPSQVAPTQAEFGKTPLQLSLA